jgi:hypothetical protein
VSTGIAIDKARLESDQSTANIAMSVHANDTLTPGQREAIRRVLEGDDDSPAPERRISEIIAGGE